MARNRISGRRPRTVDEYLTSGWSIEKDYIVALARGLEQATAILPHAAMNALANAVQSANSLNDPYTGAWAAEFGQRPTTIGDASRLLTGALLPAIQMMAGGERPGLGPQAALDAQAEAINIMSQTALEVAQRRPGQVVPGANLKPWSAAQGNYSLYALAQAWGMANAAVRGEQAIQAMSAPQDAVDVMTGRHTAPGIDPMARMTNYAQQPWYEDALAAIPQRGIPIRVGGRSLTLTPAGFEALLPSYRGGVKPSQMVSLQSGGQVSLKALMGAVQAAVMPHLMPGFSGMTEDEIAMAQLQGEQNERYPLDPYSGIGGGIQTGTEMSSIPAAFVEADEYERAMQMAQLSPEMLSPAAAEYAMEMLRTTRITGLTQGQLADMIYGGGLMQGRHLRVIGPEQRAEYFDSIAGMKAGAPLTAFMQKLFPGQLLLPSEAEGGVGQPTTPSMGKPGRGDRYIGPSGAPIAVPPQVPEGMVRIYHAQAAAGKPLPDWIAQGRPELRGQWWTSDVAGAQWYMADAGSTAKLTYQDISQEAWDAARGAPEVARWSKRPDVEGFIPNVSPEATAVESAMAAAETPQELFRAVTNQLGIPVVPEENLRTQFGGPAWARYELGSQTIKYNPAELGEGLGMRDWKRLFAHELSHHYWFKEVAQNQEAMTSFRKTMFSETAIPERGEATTRALLDFSNQREEYYADANTAIYCGDGDKLAQGKITNVADYPYLAKLPPETQRAFYQWIREWREKFPEQHQALTSLGMLDKSERMPLTPQEAAHDNLVDSLRREFQLQEDPFQTRTPQRSLAQVLPRRLTGTASPETGAMVWDERAGGWVQTLAAPPTAAVRQNATQLYANYAEGRLATMGTAPHVAQPMPQRMTNVYEALAQVGTTMSTAGTIYGRAGERVMGGGGEPMRVVNVETGRTTITPEQIAQASELSRQAVGFAGSQQYPSDPAHAVANIGKVMETFIKDRVGQLQRDIEKAGGSPEVIQASKEAVGAVGTIARQMVYAAENALADQLGVSPIEARSLLRGGTTVTFDQYQELAKTSPALARALQEVGPGQAQRLGIAAQAESGTVYQTYGAEMAAGGPGGGGGYPAGPGMEPSRRPGGPRMGGALYAMYIARRFWQYTAAPVFEEMAMYGKAELAAAMSMGVDISQMAAGAPVRQRVSQEMMGQAAYETFGGITEAGPAAMQLIGPGGRRLMQTGRVAAGVGIAGKMLASGMIPGIEVSAATGPLAWAVAGTLIAGQAILEAANIADPSQAARGEPYSLGSGVRAGARGLFALYGAAAPQAARDTLRENQLVAAYLGGQQIDQRVAQRRITAQAISMSTGADEADIAAVLARQENIFGQTGTAAEGSVRTLISRAQSRGLNTSQLQQEAANFAVNRGFTMGTPEFASEAMRYSGLTPALAAMASRDAQWRAGMGGTLLQLTGPSMSLEAAIGYMNNLPSQAAGQRMYSAAAMYENLGVSPVVGADIAYGQRNLPGYQQTMIDTLMNQLGQTGVDLDRLLTPGGQRLEGGQATGTQLGPAFSAATSARAAAAQGVTNYFADVRQATEPVDAGEWRRRAYQQLLDKGETPNVASVSRVAAEMRRGQGFTTAGPGRYPATSYMDPRQWPELTRETWAAQQGPVTGAAVTAAEAARDALARLTPDQLRIAQGMAGGDIGAWSYAAMTNQLGVSGANQWLTPGGQPIYTQNFPQFARLMQNQANTLGFGNLGAMDLYRRMNITPTTSWQQGPTGGPLQMGRVTPVYTYPIPTASQIYGALAPGHTIPAADLARLDVGSEDLPAGQFAIGVNDLIRERVNRTRDLQRGQFGLQWQGMQSQRAYTQQMWGLEDQMRGMQYQSQMADFSFSFQRMDTANQFAQRGEQITAQRMAAQVDYQRWGTGFQRQGMMLGRGWQREDWQQQEQVSAMQFGWQMEDINEAIRFASGRQRRQLVTQRGRMVTMRGEEEERTETVQERQEELWAREDEAYEKQVQHQEEMIELDQRSYDLNIEQRTTFYEMDRENMERHLEEYKAQFELQTQIIEAQRAHQQEEMDRAEANFAANQRIWELQTQIQDLQEGAGKAWSDNLGGWKDLANFDQGRLWVNAMTGLAQTIDGVEPWKIVQLIALIQTIIDASKGRLVPNLV